MPDRTIRNEVIPFEHFRVWTSSYCGVMQEMHLSKVALTMTSVELCAVRWQPSMQRQNLP